MSRDNGVVSQLHWRAGMFAQTHAMVYMSRSRNQRNQYNLCVYAH